MKKILSVIFLVVMVLLAYGVLANKNDDMSVRQAFLKTVYPIFTAINRVVGTKSLVLQNDSHIKPVVSIYDLSVTMNNGTTRKMSDFKGKKLLIVNTASDCGYTGQYDELQKLYEAHRNELEILGFPANDFKEQEKGSDADIAAFCRINYGVSFPLVQKSVVRKGMGQHPVYQWLTSKERNGWTSKSPSWNFSKYLISEEGLLLYYFDPAVSPLGEEIRKAIQNP